VSPLLVRVAGFLALLAYVAAIFFMRLKISAIVHREPRQKLSGSQWTAVLVAIGLPFVIAIGVLYFSAP